MTKSIQTGTSYFVSIRAAERYYADYGHDADDVQRKIINQEIHIGKPPVVLGQTLKIIDGGRYAIVEAL